MTDREGSGQDSKPFPNSSNPPLSTTDWRHAGWKSHRGSFSIILCNVRERIANHAGVLNAWGRVSSLARPSFSCPASYLACEATASRVRWTPVRFPRRDPGRKCRRYPRYREPCRRGFLPGHGQPRSRAGQQILFVHLAKPEQEFGLVVETRADAVKHRRDVLAHGCPVGAAAGEADLLRRREQAAPLPADPLHHSFGKPSLQQFHE